MPRRAPARTRSNGAAAPKAPRDELLALARRQFLTGQRIRPEQLATQLGMARATAYRRIGNAEQLAGEVIASIVEDTFYRTLREARGQGAERVLDSLIRGMRYIVSSKPYQAFLARDPQKALRIVASKEGPVQARTIALHEALLEEEIARGALRLPVDAHTMAYALVRIVESFIYADILAGEKPDLAKAEQILALMLRGSADASKKPGSVPSKERARVSR